MASESTPTAPAEAPAEATAPAAPAAPATSSKAASKKATSKKATSKKASSKRSSSKSASKKASSKKATSKKATASSGKSATKRTQFPELKTEAACERVMKANLDSYKQYQVERDKNRNEKGMEKHRLGYRTYKNAYTQLLGLRKAAGKGRRNAKG